MVNEFVGDNDHGERKVVQICTTGVTDTMTTRCDFFTTALCDDGTIWHQGNRSSKWVQLSAIPSKQYTETI
jgi:hypothetical protein